MHPSFQNVIKLSRNVKEASAIENKFLLNINGSQNVLNLYSEINFAIILMMDINRKTRLQSAM